MARLLQNRVRTCAHRKNIYADIMGKSKLPVPDVRLYSDRAEVPNSLGWAEETPGPPCKGQCCVAGEFLELAQAFLTLGEEAAYGEF